MHSGMCKLASSQTLFPNTEKLGMGRLHANITKLIPYTIYSLFIALEHTSLNAYLTLAHQDSISQSIEFCLSMQRLEFTAVLNSSFFVWAGLG